MQNGSNGGYGLVGVFLLLGVFNKHLCVICSRVGIIKLQCFAANKAKPFRRRQRAKVFPHRMSVSTTVAWPVAFIGCPTLLKLASVADVDTGVRRRLSRQVRIVYAGGEEERGRGGG